MITSGLALLVGMAAISPEIVVARRNATRVSSGDPVATAYLAGLSDDALPALVDALPRLAEDERRKLIGLVCRDADRTYDPPATGLSWNLAKSRAQSALRELC